MATEGAAIGGPCVCLAALDGGAFTSAIVEGCACMVAAVAGAAFQVSWCRASCGCGALSCGASVGCGGCR